MGLARALRWVKVGHKRDERGRKWALQGFKGVFTGDYKGFKKGLHRDCMRRI